MRTGEFREGLKDGIPICLGYFSVSVAFGMSAVMGGLPLWAAVLISLTNLTSAGQLAGTQLVIAGGAYIEIAMTTLIINIRYFLMSLSMSQRVEQKMSMRERLAVSFGITDEIFAVAMQHPGELTASYMAGLILTPVAGWTGGTLLGGAATAVMPAMLSGALGIALYGMFIAVIVPSAKEHKNVLFAVMFAVFCSMAFAYLPFIKKISSGWAIIIITIGVSALAAWLFPVKPQDEEDTA